MTKKFDAVLKQFTKDYGDKVVRVGIHREDPDRLPSGIFALDLQLGGGIPIGRTSVLFGPESSMKTSLAMKYMAAAQKRWPKKHAVVVDIEGTFSTKWARHMGVNTDALVYVQPDNAEQVVDVVEGLTYEHEDVGFIMLDSLAAMVTQRELDSDAEDAMVGVSGLLINKLYRKVTRAQTSANNTGPTIVFINQVRYKIGGYGDPETMPGGPAWKFGSSMTIRVSGKDIFLSGEDGKLPAFKEVSVILRKWKVPVTARNGKCLIALRPDKKLKLNVGDSYDMGTIEHYLKHFELLVKAGKAGKEGWAIRDEHGEILAQAKTQDAVVTQIETDAAFGKVVRDLITRVVLERGDVLDPE